jgi:hypothetical protein
LQTLEKIVLIPVPHVNHNCSDSPRV